MQSLRQLNAVTQRLCAGIIAIILVGAITERPSIRADRENTDVVLSSTSRTYASSDDVLLQFVATNHSAVDVAWLPFPPPNSFTITVTDASGKQVQPNRSAEQEIITVGGPGNRIGPVLKSRDSFTFVSMDRTKSAFPLIAWGYSLPAGSYTIQGAFKQTKIVTNKLTIHILH